MKVYFCITCHYIVSQACIKRYRFCTAIFKKWIAYWVKASLIYEEKWVKAYIILWINIPQIYS